MPKANSPIKHVSIDKIEAESALDLLLYVQGELEGAIGQLARNTQEQRNKELLSLYQKHLSLTTNFKDMLIKTGSYLHTRNEPASEKEMEEFLDIERSAKRHASELIRWMHDNQC